MMLSSNPYFHLVKFRMYLLKLAACVRWWGRPPFPINKLGYPVSKIAL